MSPRKATPTAPPEPARAIGLVPLSAIRPDPANPRSTLGDLDGLTESIRERGVLQAITLVATGLAAPEPTWQVLYGHRRFEAAARAGLDAIPATERTDVELDSAEGRADQVLENFHRVDLTPLEEAAAFKVLVDMGWSQRKIATHVGYKQAHVSKRLKLLALPPDIRADIDDGTLTIGAGLNLVDLVDADPKWMREARKAIVEHDITPADAVREQLQAIEWEERTEATLQALQAEGVEIIRWPSQQWGQPWKVLEASAKELAKELGPDVVARLPYSVRELVDAGGEWRRIKLTKAAAKKAGHLAAVITPQGFALYVCTKPEEHTAKPAPRRRSADEIERDEAAKAQRDAEQARRQAREAAAGEAIDFAEQRLFPLEDGPARVAVPVVAAKESATKVGDTLLRMLAARAVDEFVDLLDGSDDEVRLLTFLGITWDEEHPDQNRYNAAATWLQEVVPTYDLTQLVAAAAAIIAYEAAATWRWAGTEGDHRTTVLAFQEWLAAHGHADHGADVDLAAKAS